MSIHVIDGNNFIKDAFYAMPDFSDEEGNRISGVYGALYKLKSMLSTDGEALFAFSFEEINESEFTPAVIWQAARFKDILNNAGTPEILDVTKGASGSSELISFLADELAKLSPTGKVSQTPQFNLAISHTSDLGEVEAIFTEAHDYGVKSRENYIGYFLMREGTKDPSSKKKETVGIALCYDENKAVYIPAENFVSESYIGNKLTELSKDCSLVTFDIKDGYDIFEPFEISDRTN